MIMLRGSRRALAGAALCAAAALAGCSRSGSSRVDAIESYVVGEAAAVADASAPALARIPSAAATLALYAPDTDATLADAIHSLAVVGVNRSGVGGVLVSGPASGAFTLTLFAGNSLVPGFSGTMVVRFLDELGEAVTSRDLAAEVVELDVDVDLVSTSGLRVTGEVEVELATAGVPALPLGVEDELHVEVSADLAVAFGEGGSDDGHGHEDEGHDDEGDGHDDHAGEGGEGLEGEIDLELVGLEIVLDGHTSFAAAMIHHGEGAMSFVVSMLEGSRSAGGHIHGGADTVDGRRLVRIPVTVAFDFSTASEEEGDLEEGHEDEGEHAEGTIEPEGEDDHDHEHEHEHEHEHHGYLMDATVHFGGRAVPMRMPIEEVSAPNE